jgi:hypothetical protein
MFFFVSVKIVFLLNFNYSPAIYFAATLKPDFIEHMFFSKRGKKQVRYFKENIGNVTEQQVTVCRGGLE